MAYLGPDQSLQARAQCSKQTSLAQGAARSLTLALFSWHCCQAFFQQRLGPLGWLFSFPGCGFYQFAIQIRGQLYHQCGHHKPSSFPFSSCGHLSLSLYKVREKESDTMPLRRQGVKEKLGSE